VLKDKLGYQALREGIIPVIALDNLKEAIGILKRLDWDVSMAFSPLEFIYTTYLHECWTNVRIKRQINRDKLPVSNR